MLALQHVDKSLKIFQSPPSTKVNKLCFFFYLWPLEIMLLIGWETWVLHYTHGLPKSEQVLKWVLTSMEFLVINDHSIGHKFNQCIGCMLYGIRNH